MPDLPDFSLEENDCNELFITQTSRNDVVVGVHEVQSSCEGVALITFNPWGVVQVKIHRFSAREMLLFQVKGGQGHHAAHNASPVKMDFFHSLCPGVIVSSIVCN